VEHRIDFAFEQGINRARVISRLPRAIIHSGVKHALSLRLFTPLSQLFDSLFKTEAEDVAARGFYRLHHNKGETHVETQIFGRSHGAFYRSCRPRNGAARKFSH
jgi:hypothetical protein